LTDFVTVTNAIILGFFNLKKKGLACDSEGKGKSKRKGEGLPLTCHAGTGKK